MATTIMLDAGHGGYDNGATYMERREKDDRKQKYSRRKAFAFGSIAGSEEIF